MAALKFWRKLFTARSMDPFAVHGGTAMVPGLALSVRCASSKAEATLRMLRQRTTEKQAIATKLVSARKRIAGGMSVGNEIEVMQIILGIQAVIGRLHHRLWR